MAALAIEAKPAQAAVAADVLVQESKEANECVAAGRALTPAEVAALQTYAEDARVRIYEAEKALGKSQAVADRMVQEASNASQIEAAAAAEALLHTQGREAPVEIKDYYIRKDYYIHMDGKSSLAAQQELRWGRAARAPPRHSAGKEVAAKPQAAPCPKLAAMAACINAHANYLWGTAARAPPRFIYVGKVSRAAAAKPQAALVRKHRTQHTHHLTIQIS